MIQKMYQKVAIQILLLIIVIYGLTKLFHYNGEGRLYILNEQFYYSDKQQPNLPSDLNGIQKPNSTYKKFSTMMKNSQIHYTEKSTILMNRK